MSEVTSGDIKRLEQKMELLAAEVYKGIDNINNSIIGINDELRSLADSFQKMLVEQKKVAALQQAATELVRVRQELEQNFGNYKVIRETMLGILQATDLALVKKTTISRVSEELMLSTPKYWLAPLLVAIAAWISNDRDLAERAISEAVKRDEERTALTMALICRRNNRIQTCYEWLSIYFAKQDAANFSEATFTYIDAYVNGVFGPDDKNMCTDYISKWINEIRGRSSLFEKEQEELWKGYCERFAKEIGSEFPELKEYVQEYDKINAYVSRIKSVDAIADNFKGIMDAYVDQERLKTTIDKNLINLVSRYDDEEEPLRREEKYLLAVKKYEGDTEAARKSIEAEEQLRQVKTLNIVEQMVKVINSEADVSPSEKKTAVSFLRGYIQKGFNSYIIEKKDDFPESITLAVNGWRGTTTDGSNYMELCTDYNNFLSELCNREIVNASRSNEPKIWMGASIVVGVMALIMMFASLQLGVFFILGAGACAFMIKKSKENINKRIDEINQRYSDLSNNGNYRIQECIEQWKKAKNIVDVFNNEPIRNIVA